MPTVPGQQFEKYRPDLADALEEFDLEASQMGFVGLDIAPVIEVGVTAGDYPKIALGELLKDRDTRRAEDGTYPKGQGKGTKDTFATEEHGLEERVDEREANVFREWWDAEVLAARRCRDAVLRNHNQRVIDLALAISGSAAAGTAWSSTSSATPIANVRAACIAVRNRTGMVPNAMVIDWEAYQYLKDCAEIVDRVKYSGLDDPKRGNMTVSALAQALGLEHISISGAQVNSANEAQSVSLASQWTKTIALVYCRAGDNNLRRPRFMNTFHWGADGSTIGGTMESYYDPSRRSDIVRHRMDTDEKVVYGACGQLITGVL